jgi:protein phosphatase
MGTTATVLVLMRGRYLVGRWATAGPTLLRDGQFTQLTKDHSYVQEQVDAGLLTPEQARVHPYSNVITRCVGASVDVVPDLYFRSPQVR